MLNGIVHKIQTFEQSDYGILEKDAANAFLMACPCALAIWLGVDLTWLSLEGRTSVSCPSLSS